MRPLDLAAVTLPRLEREMAGLSPVHARRLWQTVHRELTPELSGPAHFQPPLRRWLEGNAVALTAPEVARVIRSEDGWTRKFLLRLADGQTVETVLMGYPGRFTACLSTQAGCAMGCVFCATGQAGFTRHLTTGEIVAQVLHCQRELRRDGRGRLRNLVLMGMGEPLHNYDNVMTALEIVTDPRGGNLGPSRISISTVGVVPGIRRLAEERRPYNLAVSLHGASEADRAALVPVSQRWPLHELMASCRHYTATTGRKIFFEWTLIAGENDTVDQARQVAELLRGIPAHVNLIPLNPTAGYAGTAASESSAHGFQRILREEKIPSTIRQRRGLDVAAGCGQLRARAGES